MSSNASSRKRAAATSNGEGSGQLPQQPTRKRPRVGGIQKESTDSTDVSPNADHGPYQQKIFNYTNGRKPPIHDYVSWVRDDKNGVLYAFGGRGPDGLDTANLYALSIADKKWEDLSTQLIPYTDQWYQSPRPSLPPKLIAPALAVADLPELGRFLFIFGGDESNGKGASNKLIAIDLNASELKFWSDRPISGNAGPTRVCASMVFAHNRFFIFGGRSQAGFDDTPPHRSLSIIKYDTTTKSFHWEVAEQPFPESVPAMGYNPHATALHGGHQILLLPGLEKPESVFFNITGDKIIFFNTRTRSFAPSQLGPHSVAFPKNKIISFATFPLLRRPASAPPSWQPSVLFCCWLRDPSTWRRFFDQSSDHLLLEFYHYTLPPYENHICSLKQAVKISKASSGMVPYLVCMDHQPDSDPHFFIMGSKTKEGPKLKSIKAQDEPEIFLRLYEDGDQAEEQEGDVYPRPAPYFDVYTEIDIGHCLHDEE